MSTVVRILIVLGALLDLSLGFGFLSDPASSATDFGVSVDGAMGLSSLRADFTAFFLVTGGFMLLGAWYCHGEYLAAPLALMLIALSGRGMNLLAAGPYEGWWVPMTVEAAHVAVMAAAIALWPWRGRAEA